MKTLPKKIIQNFSSRKHIAEFPLFDILIWAAGLVQFKKLGYKLKLYCDKTDYDFLNYWGLLSYYDEVDDTYIATLKTDLRYQAIDDTNFWSARKLFCLDHEWQVSTEPFIYFDTDIVLLTELPLISEDTGLLTWCDEQEDIYVSFDHLSAPPEYALPYYQLYNQKAYNCGIMWFNSKDKFNKYFEEYLKFTSHNPCHLYGIESNELTLRNIWACTAEQRLLRGIAINYNWNAFVYMNNDVAPFAGFTDTAAHYYLLRGVLRHLELGGKTPDQELIRFYNNQILLLMLLIKNNNSIAYDKLISDQRIKALIDNNVWIKKYI